MSLIHTLLHPIEELFAEHCVNYIDNILTGQFLGLFLHNREAIHYMRVLLCKIEEMFYA
jgi:hypothetical protein